MPRSLALNEPQAVVWRAVSGYAALRDETDGIRRGVGSGPRSGGCPRTEMRDRAGAHARVRSRQAIGGRLCGGNARLGGARAVRSNSGALALGTAAASAVTAKPAR